MGQSEAKIVVVGGGLAGCEAAWQCLRAGLAVELREMRPTKLTPAHKTGLLAELVCSNSLKTEQENSAPGLLKAEMRHFDSLILRAAEVAKVPAGHALAVERSVFSGYIDEALRSHPKFSRSDCEVLELPSEAELAKKNEFWIIATGPLTSEPLAKSLHEQMGMGDYLYFYDAVSPVVATDSLDHSIVFSANRYDKSSEAGADGDYLNVPFSKEEYDAFIDAVVAAEKAPLKEFEEPKYFEACLPIEVMIGRGRETLRFGPMKAVGLTDPRTGRWPYAALQLRAENKDRTMYALVGFQTKMKWPEQKRVFSQFLPGFKDVEIYRYGSIHRNTYVQGPKVLAKDLSLRVNKRAFLAGQITGVEGYVESAAIGMVAAHSLAKRVRGEEFVPPPEETVIGALTNYVTSSISAKFDPMNANFGLLPRIDAPRKASKDEKKRMVSDRARAAFKQYSAT